MSNFLSDVFLLWEELLKKGLDSKDRNRCLLSASASRKSGVKQNWSQLYQSSNFINRCDPVCLMPAGHHSKTFPLASANLFMGLRCSWGVGWGGSQEIISLKSKMIEKSCPLSRSKTQCLIFCFGDLWLLNQWHWCNFSLSKISNEKTISFDKNGGNVSRQQCMTEVQLSSYKKSKKVIINVGRIKVLLVRLSSHMSADCRAERCYRQTLLHLNPHPPLLLSFLWLSSRPCALHTTDWLAAPSTSGKTSATCFSLPFHL